MDAFLNAQSGKIIQSVIISIQDNKQFLSDVDGAIGDGDHGINMNKGFTLCENELAARPGDFTHSLRVLSRVLMADIGGSMGPLYGSFFRAMGKASAGQEKIDAALFGQMLSAGEEAIKNIGGAQVGDKTLLDCLVPAVDAFNACAASGGGFADALVKMKQAALIGRDSTKDMVAKVGRSSRLGERSRGVLDAGACSCYVILEAMADAIASLL